MYDPAEIFNPRLTRTNMDSNWVTGGGETGLSVQETGNPNGRAILFVHGYSQSHLSWTHQIASELADDFRLVTMDLRGHGNSGKPRDRYTDSALWADDIRAVVDALELDTPVLVGWSLGGVVVLDYLAKYGDKRISGINLVGAPSGLGTKEAMAIIGDSFLSLVPGLETNDPLWSVRTLKAFLRRCFHEKPSPRVLRFLLGFNLIVPPYVRAGINDRSITHDEVLRTLKIPALVTHGVEDRIVLPAAGESHARLIDEVDTSFYPSTGHSPFWEVPTRFNDELREFVSEL